MLAPSEARSEFQWLWIAVLRAAGRDCRPGRVGYDRKRLMRDSLLIQTYLALVVVAACSASGSGTTPGTDLSGGTSATGGIVASGGSGGSLGGSAGTIMASGGSLPVGGTGAEDPDAREPLCTADCADLASDGPLLDDGVPANAPDMFGGSASGSGPCILEPGDHSLVPFNWLRPRVKIGGFQSGTIYQIKVSTPREKDVLVAYTNRDTWILPPEYWDNDDPDAPKGLTYNAFDEDITVSVRAAGGGESNVSFQIAPVKAGGSMVFWSSNTTEPGANTNALYGFAAGDEGIVSALKPLEVLETIMDDNAGSPKRAITDSQVGAVPAGGVRCVGCHTSTPDGAAVNITDHWPWNVRLVNLSGDNRGHAPDYVTPMGDLLMQMPWQGVTTYSKGDWDAGHRRYVTSFAPRPSTVASEPWKFWGVDCGNGVECPYTGHDDLIWVDLAAAGTPPTDNNDNAISKALIAAQNAGWGIIARTGDANGAVLPDFSHDGTSIVYTSTDATADGHVGVQPYKNVPVPTKVDLFTVPFNDGQGGPAAPVAGASGPDDAEYYPDYSADDALLAYTRVSGFKQIFAAAANDEGRKIYYRPEAEVFVVPSAGGTATRLDANDPPACSGESSPGVYNSWPKWSPIVREANGKKYYFLLFSSARQSVGNIKTKEGTDVMPVTRMSQLYMAAIVEQAGVLTSYGASYLWNQRYLVTGPNENPVLNDFAQNNVTPAWDEFQAPPVPPVVVVVK